MSGHSWKWRGDFKILRNARGEITEFSRLRQCQRCKTYSIKVYDGKTGRLIRRTYRYVDGYMVDSKVLKFEPGAAALESLRRSFENNRVQENGPAPSD